MAECPIVLSLVLLLVIEPYELLYFLVVMGGTLICESTALCFSIVACGDLGGRVGDMRGSARLHKNA